MDIQAALALSLKVLSDWRVIFITVSVLLIWAALRSVGSVYHKRPRARSKPPASSVRAAPSAKASGKAARAEAPSGGSDGLVE